MECNMNNSNKKKMASAREEHRVSDPAQRATTIQQILLTLKLIGIVGLVGGLLWALDNIRVQ